MRKRTMRKQTRAMQKAATDQVLEQINGGADQVKMAVELRATINRELVGSPRLSDVLQVAASSILSRVPADWEPPSEEMLDLQIARQESVMRNSFRLEAIYALMDEDQRARVGEIAEQNRDQASASLA